MERTLVILKPDTVKRKLVGEVISRFEKKDYSIIQMKMVSITKEVAYEHYSHVKSEPFFDDMIKYITCGPVVAMIISGERVISTVRNMIGKTSCYEAQAGTIRGDFGSHKFMNLIHASDSIESAEIEIKRFFPELT